MSYSSRSSNWGSKNPEKGNDKSGWGWGKKVEEKADETGWKKKDGWGSSNAGDWKNKRDRPSRPIGGSNDGPRASGPFTATRQHLDIFTVEEQDVLSNVELIMQSIRRIMHQTGYNDGDPLFADDQSYILENVFKYHPDKEQKMGTGIDYVMVNKHSSFQESRCLYIVSTDGRKEDFSYRKCLENFIRGKYPDKVEAFMPKYFRKPQPRPSWNKDRSSGPDDARGSRGGRNSGFTAVGQEDAGTPRSGWGGWNSGSTAVGQEDAGTPKSGWGGWNSGSSAVGQEDAGTPQSGWNGGSTPAPEEAGTPRSGWGS